MNDAAHFLDGGDEVATTIRAFDWATTNLGPIEEWPSSLKIAVSMMLNSRFPKCIVWGPQLITIHNDAFLPILGDKPQAIGQPFDEVWKEAWPEIGPIAERAFAGEPTFIKDFPLLVNRHGYLEQAYFTFCYSPIRDEAGVVRGMMDTVIETTATVEARRQASLLNRELQHRIKNTLAVVAAIINQTLRVSDSDSDARAVLLERIRAMAEAQTLLVDTNIAEASVLDVVRAATTPFKMSEDRFFVNGPPIMLSSRQALSLSLAIHELATNALKYGALSNGSGKINIEWQTGRPATDEEFRFLWVESGGPEVSEPVRKGFGSQIVQTVLPADFCGQADLVLPPSGLRYELKTFMHHIGGDPAPSSDDGIVSAVAS